MPIFQKLSPAQFGFLLNSSSCVQQLVLVVQEVAENWESNSWTNIGYLDIKKVFDSVTHKDLLQKLHMVGVGDSVWNLFKEYYLTGNNVLLSIVTCPAFYCFIGSATR